MARLTWIHSDERGLSRAVESAVLRARQRDWAPSAEARADARALVFGALATAARIGGRPPVVGGEDAVTYWPSIETTRPDGSRQFQQALLDGVVVLLADGAVELLNDVRIETRDASPASVAQETGFGFAAAAAVITVGGIVAATVAYWFSQRNELEAIKLGSSERVQKHAAELAAVTETVDSHVTREAESGKAIPWSEGERAVLDRLLGSIAELAKAAPPPMQTVPNVSEATKSIGEGLGSGLNWALLVALVAAVALE